ncbi:MAG: hypothetical protein JNM93_03095 [Bacteriovoracaceae bacterium]|nr:hypothetical protein [Bacteriovoracaceae bacterium]
MKPIKDFIKDNPVPVTVAGVMLLALLLDFGGPETVDGVSREPASNKSKKYRNFSDLDIDEEKINSRKRKMKKSQDMIALDESGGGLTSTSTSSGSGSAGSEAGGASYGGIAEHDSGASDSYTPEPEEIVNNIPDGPDGPEDDGPPPQNTPDVPPELSYCEKYPSSSSCIVTSGGPGGGPTTTGGSSTSTTTGGGPVVNCELSISPGDGSFVVNPTAEITGTNVSEIYYCQNKGSTCDPVENGNAYSTAFEITTTPGVQDNGTFYVSYYGVCNGKATSIKNVTYVVDDTAVPINLYSTPMIVQLQTQEAHLYLQVNSTAFGADGYSHFTYNVGTTDPTSSTCTDLAENLGYTLTGNAMRSIASVEETDTSNLAPTNYVSVPMVPSRNDNMSYGYNWLVSFMKFEDADGNRKYGCLSNQVRLHDFNFMTILRNNNFKTTPNANGVSTFQGGIQNFGHFGGTAVSGPGVGSSGSDRLEVDLINVIN